MSLQREPGAEKKSRWNREEKPVIAEKNRLVRAEKKARRSREESPVGVEKKSRRSREEKIAPQPRNPKTKTHPARFTP
jgi:hypothetical protein